MTVVRAEQELLAPRKILTSWALVSRAVPPAGLVAGYTDVERTMRSREEPAGRSCAAGRQAARRPGGQGTIVLRRVDPTLELRWHDVAQQLEAGIELANAAPGRTRAVVSVERAWWRVNVEGARRLPEQALTPAP